VKSTGFGYLKKGKKPGGRVQAASFEKRPSFWALQEYDGKAILVHSPGQ
jgi:hypothetical protein